MRIRLHNGLQSPRVLEATSVVVEDDAGNVIFAAQAGGQRGIDYTHIDDPNYQTMLQMFGIKKSLIINEIPEKRLSDVIWTP